MRRIIFLVFACLSVALSAQTVFWTEGFGTGCDQLQSANGLNASGNGAWTVVNGFSGISECADANVWYISATEAGMAVGTCGSGCLTNAALTNRTLHIGSIANGTGFSPCTTGDCGAAYDAGGTSGFGGTTTCTSKLAASPTINCTGQNNITMTFNYIQSGQVGFDFAQVMYSANGGTTWTSLTTPQLSLTENAHCPVPGGDSTGFWTRKTISLPASANNNPNVEIGFWWQNNDDGMGFDPSIAIDSIKLASTSTVTPLTVSITPSPTTTICQSSSVTLTGSASGTVTTWSWSVTPSAGVTFSPSATSQSVTVTFTTSGIYTFTLTATGSSTATATQTITVNPSVVPSVSITANPGNPVCAGQTVSFTATPTNGGTTPIYQWQVNAVNAGTNSPTFTTNVASNETVSVMLTSNATCATPATTTQSYTVLTSAAVTPSVIITPTVSICAGTLVTFTATPTNGGSIPSYSWAIGGTNVGTNAPTFTTTTLTNGAVVSVTLTSNAGCVTTTTASAAETVTVQPSVTPSVVLSPTVNICSGTTVNFTATPTNGGATPSYSWAVGGIPQGTNSPNFSSSTLTNGAIVSVTLTSNAACTTTNTVSASETVTVTPTVTPSVNIVANPGNPICAGQTVSLTATPTNGGAAPLYQWQVNGINVGTNTTTPTFTATSVASSETITVILTSNAACTSTTTVLATDTIKVSTPQVPSVTITSNPTGACSGGSATFTANPTNGGSIPAYQWAVNGVSVPTGTASVFTATNVVSTETISVTLTSNAGCVTTNTATAVATVTISPAPTLTVTKGSINTVCPNAPDTIIVSGPVGATYSWTPAAGLNVTNTNTVVATNSVVGSYSYNVTCTVAGCTSANVAAIVIVSNAAVTTGSTYSICSGQKANLTASGGSTYTWTPSSTLSCSVCINPVATPSTTTIYTVTTTSGACNSVTTNTVFVNPAADALFIDTVTIKGVPQTVTFTNTSTNGTGYIWNFGDNTTLVQNNLSATTHTFTAAGTYSVTLIAFGANGCNDTTTQIILVIDSVGLTMPNIFTPNGDGINDVFAPNAHGMKTLSCVIYDRWGIKIVTLDNSNMAYWDGHTTSGIECTDGTYFYMVTATDINNKSYNLKGFLQLIR